jgi:hypothetical protein
MRLEERDVRFGGENRSGGDCAKGIPRNWFTGPKAVGRVVDFPTTTPASIVAVGALLRLA